MIDVRLKEKLLSMTWEGLREWSDSKSVERGKGYLNEVETPAVFADGSVVSEVHGSDDYYAKLAVDGKGELQGVCTCPVGRRCKHTVALALVAAIGDDEPELALKFWQWRIAENRDRTDRHCYQKIGVALRKMRPLMERLGCSDEWLRLLNDLRTEGKMRRNLVAILNEIDREQGGSGRIADAK